MMLTIKATSIKLSYAPAREEFMENTPNRQLRQLYVSVLAGQLAPAATGAEEISP
jgi:hypothetical protein